MKIAQLVNELIELACTLEEISISNFKSLKNVHVPLRKFNILIGPNGSGKTNFVEFFKFLKKALTELQRPYTPYLDWWDYRNIVWRRKEELPITAKLHWIIHGLDLQYELSFSGIGGAFRILYEKITIENMIVLEREGSILKIEHDKEFFERNYDAIQKEVENIKYVLPLLSARSLDEKQKIESLTKEITAEDLQKEQVIGIPSDLPSLFQIRTFPIPRVRTKERNMKGALWSEIIGKVFSISIRSDFAIVILPQRYKEPNKPLNLEFVLRELYKAIAGFTILKHPNMMEVKSASLPRRESTLLEDSSNLNNVLYKWFSEKGKLPDRIEAVISELFPNIHVGFEQTFDGRIYMKIFENEIELHPPSIPDGLYKILSILAAVELKPSLLAVDEIENSLHKEALEYVLDELKESDSTVIIATHSPLVVDMARIEDLLIVEKTEEGTTLSRIKSPEKIRNKLAELKITQSESWLYGDLK